MHITVKIEITAQRVADLMITGIEGGIGYWARDVQVSKMGSKGYLVPASYQKADSYEGDWTVEGRIQGVSDEDDEPWSFTRDEFLDRITKAPKWHLDAWLDENEDAGTADALIQCAAFGEIFYG
jgi:hypothetical protein